MYWLATLVAPRAVQGYFSPTPLNVLVCEGFSACPAKCSLHLDSSRAMVVEMQRRFHKRANMFHATMSHLGIDI